MRDDKKIQAFIWDFDGTLVDTRQKNYRVAREIVSEVTSGSPDDLPAMRTLEDYEKAIHLYPNWRHFYQSQLGLTDEETDAAGMLWSPFQIRDITPTPAMDGMVETLQSLQDYPHGIVSQNSSRTIRESLDREQIADHFDFVIGYEEVHLRRQKPAPDGLLLCIDRLIGKRSKGYVVFVGDHETDTVTAHNANRVLQESGADLRVLAVAAHYGSPIPVDEWQHRPHYVADNPQQVVEIKIAFEDDSDAG